jgi:ATP-dependent Clp protease adaptor protein ClpS
VIRSDDHAAANGSCAMIGDAALNEHIADAGACSDQEETIEQSVYRVLLVDDDATPMEFVVWALLNIFGKTQEDAERIMLTTHHTGMGLCGVYMRRDAEVLVGQVAELARQNKHPLQCLLEPTRLLEPADCDVPPALGEWRVLTRLGSLGDLPAFVLEAGGGCTRDHWRFVQRCLGRQTLVVSYDRAGLGWNTEWALDVSAGGVAARLAALLAQAVIPSPYVLVGHSLGGLFVQYYAAKYPRDVAGLVLVDATDTDYFRYASALQDFAPGGRLWDPFSNPSRETAALGTTQVLVRRCPVAQEVPILAVSAGTLPQNPELRRAQASLIEHHKKTAARSTFGRHVLMTQADHGSLLLNPEHATEVAEHILDFAETFCRTPPAVGNAAGA